MDIDARMACGSLPLWKWWQGCPPLLGEDSGKQKVFLVNALRLLYNFENRKGDARIKMKKNELSHLALRQLNMVCIYK